MARVIAAIIRHGDYCQLPATPSAQQPFPLNARGRAHAGLAATNILETCNLQGWELIPAINCSRMLRGWQTARLIADRLAVEIRSDFELLSYDALAERGLGSAANLTLKQIEQVMRDDPRFPEPPPGWRTDSHYRLPLQGAESLMDAGKRVANHLIHQMEGLDELAVRDSLKLFVGHGAAFRHAAYQLGVLEFDQLSRLSMHHGVPVYLEFLGDCAWRHVAGKWKVRSVACESLDE